MKDFGKTRGFTGFTLKMRGFTLLELMIILMLIAVFAAFAVPAFKHRMERTKVEASTDELLTALRFARGEAITRGTEVSLAPKVAAAPLDDGWNVETQNFGGASVLLREHNALNGVKVCTGANVCGQEIEFTFTPRGSMKVKVAGTQGTSVTLLVRPEIYNVAGNASSCGAGLLLDVNAQGHARISEDSACTI
ncbi:MAG: GspH/FimT family protein [Zoogloeaceae bacterium]|jgi:prepilin-type N-terminal cleavage/methylation domain-containing protein|nr:GspH/FimT family protein [Zoogloeaceae bacterium]